MNFQEETWDSFGIYVFKGILNFRSVLDIFQVLQRRERIVLGPAEGSGGIFRRKVLDLNFLGWLKSVPEIGKTFRFRSGVQNLCSLLRSFKE